MRTEGRAARTDVGGEEGRRGGGEGGGREMVQKSGGRRFLYRGSLLTFVSGRKERRRKMSQ